MVGVVLLKPSEKSLWTFQQLSEKVCEAAEFLLHSCASDIILEAISSIYMYKKLICQGFAENYSIDIRKRQGYEIGIRNCMYNTLISQERVQMVLKTDLKKKNP